MPRKADLILISPIVRAIKGIVYLMLFFVSCFLQLSAELLYSTTKKQCPSWPTGREVMTTYSCRVRGYNSTLSPTVQKHYSVSYSRARQRCFWLSVLIRRPQVSRRLILISGRLTLTDSLIPSDKYFLKNLTFVVRISTRVATSPFQSNSLRGKGEDQQLKSNVLPGLPDGKSCKRKSSLKS